MRLDYRINNQNHSIFFCKKRKFEKISTFLNKIKSDKNVLFIFDSNIKKKLFLAFLMSSKQQDVK